jgi:hypothetical protein
MHRIAIFGKQTATVVKALANGTTTEQKGEQIVWRNAEGRVRTDLAEKICSGSERRPQLGMIRSQGRSTSGASRRQPPTRRRRKL